MFDYHSHTSFSCDSVTSPDDMIKHAISLGIKEYAITDHYDPDYNDDMPFDLDFPAYHRMLLEKEDQYKKEIRIVKGIEIGIQGGETEDKCNIAANAFEYDFILGSFHSCLNMPVDKKEFYENHTGLEIYRIFYENMYNCLKTYKNYDIIGHFSIIDRYADAIPDFKEYAETVSEILKLIIADDKGLELNTSSFRYNMMPTTLPRKEILQMFFDYGGRNITMGSDAHATKHIRYGFDEMKDYLRSFGFSKLATFKNRELSLVDL